MKTTGKILLIAGIVALVSAICFGLSVAALGVSGGDYGISIGGNDVFHSTGNWSSGVLFRDGDTNIKYDYEPDKSYTMDFPSPELTDIALNTASCRTTLTAADTDKVSVEYKTSDTPMSFSAEMKDGILTITEKTGFRLVLFGSYTSAELNVTVPETLYRSLTLNTASGGVTAEGLTLDKLTANIASGSYDLSLYAQDMELSVASGNIKLANITGDPAGKININAASGNITLDGFGADSTKVRVASGKVTLKGISGRVDGELMSGGLELAYSEWNDDLDIDLASGTCDVTLPAGSGVEIDFDRASGSAEIDLDNDSVKLSKNARADYGGDNRHKADIEVASGKIRIHN